MDMKQPIYLFCYYLMTVFALTGCRQEELMEQTNSGLLLTLTDTPMEVTRATPAELGKPAAENFRVKIVQSTGQVIYDDLFTEQLIPASEGQYTLTATWGENPILDWDAPYYEGTASAAVNRGNTHVSIPCKVANALLSVSFNQPEVFEAIYSAYAVQVEADHKTLEITAATAPKSAYFRAGTALKVSFHAVLKEGGKEVVYDLNKSLQAYLPLAAGSHARISLRASNTILEVEKVEVTQVTVNETLPPGWLPKPQVNGFAEGSTTLQTVETNDALPAAIGFTAATPIQDAAFTLELEDEHLKLLNGTYTLSELKQEQRTLLEQHGIGLPALHTKEGALDLTGLTAWLRTNDGTTTHNKASLRIKANDRWSDEQTPATEYVIETVKPEFAVSAQAGNCWAREFTIDEITVTSGKAATLKKQLVYQYYDGKQWVDCENRNRVKGRTQQFTAAAEELSLKKYRIRALYRGVIASTEAEVTLENPVQLPNADMNNWTHETYGKRFYSFMPYNEQTTPAWDTNNLYTTRHRHNTVGMDNYNGFHAVSYVPGKGGTGYAAELRSTANGRGNTRFFGHTELDHNKVAGELFTGTGKLHLEGNDINGKDRFEHIKDTSHPSRPTGVRFFYQYLPYHTDSWSVHLELLDGNKQVISATDFQAGDRENDWTEATVQLNYTDEKLQTKCEYIYLLFCSTTHPGAGMPYQETEQTFYVGENTQKFKPAYVGSILRIDDIALIYDK